MADHDRPFRLRVLGAITDALREITPANGYAVDLSDTVDDDNEPQPRVYRGRAEFGATDPVPMVSILESVDAAKTLTGQPRDSSFDKSNWILILQGWVGDDKANPTDPAYVLLADVRRRLLIEKGRKHPTSPNQNDPFGLGVVSSGGSGNSINGLAVGFGICRPPDHISSMAYWWCELGLEINEQGLTPYA